jgi:hypothetical protein
VSGAAASGAGGHDSSRGARKRIHSGGIKGPKATQPELIIIY